MTSPSKRCVSTSRSGGLGAAKIGSTPNTPRCSSMNEEGAVELRLGKICRRLAKNLVGLSKLLALPLKSLHLLGHIARQACSFAAVDFGLLDPFIERLRRAADLGGD